MICEFSAGLGALLLLLVGLFGRWCSAAGMAFGAVGGVWSACGGLVGRGGVLWADAVKIGKMLSASSPTSQELFGVVACC